MNDPATRSESTAPVHVLATASHGRWSAVTLELLGDGLPLAKRWNDGVTVWWPVAPGVRVPDANELARHGAARLCVLRHPRFDGWSAEAVAAALAREIPPGARLLLLPGTATGEEAAALLEFTLQRATSGVDATPAPQPEGRTAAAWIPDVLTMSLTRANALEITAVEPGGRLSRVHRVAESGPVVVTIRPGVAEAKPVSPAAGIDVIERDVDLSDLPELTRVVEELPADPATVDLAFANRIVAGGRGTGGPEGMALVSRLASALGAAPAASRMAVDLGWAPPARQVGQTGKTVRPDLYIACGISGASHHLAGMRDSRHIVALNPDPQAPIHEVAQLSLHGDLHAIIPAVEAALHRRRASAETA